MVEKHGEVLLNFKEKPISPTSFIPFIVPIYEGKDSLSCNGDIWIPNGAIFESHKSSFLFLG
jgi:hypothetical protein